ncbi:NAD(+)/NADH kinase [candidate division KSB1 bacterium]
MKIGIYGHSEKKQVVDYSSELLEILCEKNIQCFVEKKLGLKLKSFKDLNFVEETELPDYVDLFIVFGGDGTVLRLTGIAKGKNIPILAVNAGKLGFLTDLSPEELPENIDKIIKGHYPIEERIMLEGSVGNLTIHALNDIVINRGGYPRIIKIGIDIGEHHFNTYYCDGIIIATPTGSTAYSLSSGGPIIHPSLEAVLISPIATHSLSARHVVIPTNKIINVTVLSEDISSELHADGQKISILSPNAQLKIKISDNTVKLIRIGSKNFFDVLRNKLNWGKENR